MLKKKYLIAFLNLFLFSAIVNSQPQISIDLHSSFSFHSIIIKNNSSQFYPSYFGGISLIDADGKVFYPWSSDVKFKLLKIENDSYAEWIMYKDYDFYYHYGIELNNQQDNLKIHIKDLGEIPDNSLPKYYAEAYALYLDRCENAICPVVIGVPYLTMFNILFANNCFVSFYFDWNKTNASQLVVYNSKSYSSTSEFYSEYALYNPLTNGIRNKLDETIYLKVSDNFDDVLPDLQNPISKYKEESSKRILFDDWVPFNKSFDNILKISQNGISNVWHIVHQWQRFGYDVALPDVFPANSKYGGNEELIRISNFDKKLGFLFALHENYIDIFTKSSKFKPENLALNPNGRYIFNWYNGDTSYIVKPTGIFNNLIPTSTQIHNTFETNSAYHDVGASYDPSKYVDYDYRVDGAGKFSTTYNIFKAIADTLRRIHEGPVSSEGLAHFLYVGYYDDISSAQIHTAKSLPGSYGTETEGGFYKPLLVDFDLLKMKEKIMVHGVGYYGRFFYHNNNFTSIGCSMDSALMYAATELVYGHGAFFSSESYNLIVQGLIEYKYVYPIQRLYGNSRVVKILYYDKGNLLTASDYIRKYPDTFDKFGDKDFMSQVYIEYENGLKIYVNRNTTKKWTINFEGNYGFYSTHSLIDGKDSLFVGDMNGRKFILPENSGWICFYKN